MNRYRHEQPDNLRRKIEGECVSFAYEGDYFSMIHDIQTNIVSEFRSTAFVQGLRFVGSASPQRRTEQSRVMDLAVHILVDTLTPEVYLSSVAQLTSGWRKHMATPGPHLGSVGVVRGAYKPPPIAGGVRVFIHAFIGDEGEYMMNNPLARYAWIKYGCDLGSFDRVDSQVSRPTLHDVTQGPGGLVDRYDQVLAGHASIRMLQVNDDDTVTSTEMVTGSPSHIHELYTSAVVFTYRHLCRALGLLEEGELNSELVSRSEGTVKDLHQILTEAEARILDECVRSKRSLRNGSLDELKPHRIKLLRNMALEYLRSLICRFGR